jgi:peptidoglycan/LPS O-acetylase OafA/YrhL
MIELAWLGWTGRISYGLYLWHVPAFHFAAKHFPENVILQNGFALASTIVISAATFYLIEKPCVALKDQYHAAPLFLFVAG